MMVLLVIVWALALAASFLPERLQWLRWALFSLACALLAFESCDAQAAPLSAAVLANPGGAR